MDMYVTYLRRGGGGGLCELAKPIMHIFVSEVDAFKMPLCAQVHVKGGERSEKKKREREKEEKREVREVRRAISNIPVPPPPLTTTTASIYPRRTCTVAPSTFSCMAAAHGEEGSPLTDSTRCGSHTHWSCDVPSPARRVRPCVIEYRFIRGSVCVCV